ncbi:MAG: hypothetical protein R3270_04620 [Gammaproteobacteria bacterium]|nr:hypothetical protein [Gammaproteobacteria bacterium]
MEKISKATLISTIALLATAASATAHAGFGIGARAGTLGLTYEATLGFTDFLAIRAGVNGYDTDYDTTEDEINYNFDADLKSRHLLLDVHPFAGTFRITGGFVQQDTLFTGVGTSNTSYTIGSTTYSPADIGSVTASAGWDDRYSYIGLGWGKSPSGEGFGFSFDVGVVLQESPTVNIVVDSPLLNDPVAGPQLQANIDEEEAQLRSDMEEFDTYPVISLGISYHF